MTFSIRRRQLVVGGLVLPLLGAQPKAQAQPVKTDALFKPLLRPTVHSGQESWTLADRMAHYNVPGVAIAILRGWQIESVSGYGTAIAGQSLPIHPGTLFSVGSVSKVATAALCLRLVADGHFALDQDVNRWLRRWQMPAGPTGDTAAVTLRMLLSHTAGLNLHGFADFPPAAPLPTPIQTLNGISPAPNRPLARIDAAGSRTRYSGGGYMVVQALIEDALSAPFDEVARRYLFGPLGMTRSRFVAAPVSGIGDIAWPHDKAGKLAAQPRGWQSFPELAPSGLWTSAADLAQLVQALGTSHRGAIDAYLPRAVAAEMMTPVSPSMFGLGPRLAGSGQGEIFHHAGANDSYKAYIEGNLASGDGLVILTNGANGDVLGDEIRNGVSDALRWPGDWSVVVIADPDVTLLDSLAGRYKRRAGQAREIISMLDTTWDVESLVIDHNADGLRLLARGRERRLAPIGSARFVVPDAYVPASTLQLVFKRNAFGRTESLVVSGGGDLLFDRVS